MLLYRCTYRGQCQPQAPTSPAKMILEYLYDQCAHFLIQTMTGLKKGNVEVGKNDHYTNGPHSTTLMLSLFPLAINLKNVPNSLTYHVHAHAVVELKYFDRRGRNKYYHHNIYKENLKRVIDQSFRLSRSLLVSYSLTLIHDFGRIVEQ